MTRKIHCAWIVAGSFGCLLLLCCAFAADARATGVYFIKEGDTLPGVARIFGVEVESIVELNRLRGVNLKQGDQIRIPDKARKPSAHRPADSSRIHQAICREESVFHPVAKGDTLYAISRRYATDLDSLLQLNGLTISSRLSVGQMILVRHSGPRTHTVARGETLGRIAARSGVPAEKIAQLNRIDGSLIIAGQRLLLEDCDPLAAAGTAPPPLGKADADLIGALPARSAGGPLAVPAAPAAEGTDSFSAAARTLMHFAKTMLDIPYRFGGTTLRGIDCSAFVQRVFGSIDVQLPRTAREQYRIGARVDRHELEVGDLVFFRTYASFPSHVGIYVGQNQFIHASSMVRKVTIDSMDRSYYSKRFIGARRLFADEVATR